MTAHHTRLCPGRDLAQVKPGTGLSPTSSANAMASPLPEKIHMRTPSAIVAAEARPTRGQRAVSTA
jgi:hypothetical protein